MSRVRVSRVRVSKVRVTTGTYLLAGNQKLERNFWEVPAHKCLKFPEETSVLKEVLKKIPGKFIGFHEGVTRIGKECNEGRHPCCSLASKPSEQIANPTA